MSTITPAKVIEQRFTLSVTTTLVKKKYKMLYKTRLEGNKCTQRKYKRYVRRRNVLTEPVAVLCLKWAVLFLRQRSPIHVHCIYRVLIDKIIKKSDALNVCSMLNDEYNTDTFCV